ncbi:MAG: PspC domain-containing protein, partial [Planctomycetota bacterium]
ELAEQFVVEVVLRDADRAWLGGVAAGLAAWYGISPFTARVLLVLSVFMSGGLTVIGYMVAIVLIRPCRDGPYRPRPVSLQLPHRPPGWIAGICALMARETGMAAGLWRLLLLIVMISIGWPVLIGYILLAVLLPSSRRFPGTARRGLPQPPAATAPPVAATDAQPTTQMLRQPQRGRTWFIAAVMLGACAWSLLLHGHGDQAAAFTVLIGAAVLTVCAALLPSLMLFRSRLGAWVAGAGMWAAPAIAFGGGAADSVHLMMAGIWLMILVAGGLLIRRYAIVAVALTLAVILLVIGAPPGRLPWYGLASGGVAPSTVLLAMLPGLWLADAVLGLLLGRRALKPGFSLIGSLLAVVVIALLVIALLGEHSWWGQAGSVD